MTSTLSADTRLCADAAPYHVATFGAASGWCWPTDRAFSCHALSQLDTGIGDALPMVVVGRWCDVDAKVLDHVHAASMRPAAAGPTLLLRDDLEAALAALVCPPPDVGNPDSDVLCHGPLAMLNGLDVAIVESGGWTVHGQLSPPDRVRTALAAGADVLVISTHGDGLDSRLPGSLQLCGEPWTARAMCAPATHCDATGDCYWTGRRVGSPDFDGLVVRPEAISARTIVFDSCFGMLTGGELFAAAESLGQRLARAATCRALVLFQGYAIEDTQNLLDLSTQLSNGLDVAVAIGAYNRSRRSQVLGRRGFVVAGRNWAPPGTMAIAGALQEEEPCNRDSSAAALSVVPRLHGWIDRIAGDVGDVRVQTALTALRRLECPRESLADLLAGLDSSGLWKKDSERIALGDTLVCPVCVATAHSFHVTIDGAARRFAQCFVCGYCADEDRPHRFKVLELHAGGVEVEALAEVSLRVRFNPAGSPKYPLDILPATAAAHLVPRSLSRTSAFSERLSPGQKLRLSPFDCFRRPIYFITVVAVDDEGYSTQTFTANFARQGKAAFAIVGDKRRPMLAR